MKYIERTSILLMAVAMVIPCSLPWEARAQNLLPNPGFESGTTAPLGWRMPEDGKWASMAHSGTHCLAVQGNGKNSAVWRTERLGLKPGGLYSFSYYGRCEATASGGCAVGGTGRVNRDNHPGQDWQLFKHIFINPHDCTNDYARLGQWETKGILYFDDASLLPVIAVHESNGQLELGEGERIQNGRYHFDADYGWLGANYHRTLLTNRCSFNSTRWTFSPGAEVVYVHEIPDTMQTRASIRLNVNYYVSGALEVSASRDGKSWLPVGQFGKDRRSGTNALPNELFPAARMLVRIAAIGNNVNLQVDGYSFESELDKKLPDTAGSTRFLEIRHAQPEIDVGLVKLQRGNAGGTWVLLFNITNKTDRTISFQATALTDKSKSTQPPYSIRPKQVFMHFPLAVSLTELGLNNVTVKFNSGSTTLFEGLITLPVTILDDPRPGYWLAEGAGVTVWWCESGWKFSPARRPPPKAGKVVPVSISAAGGEYEPAQIVLTPATAQQLLSATAGPLKNVKGQPSKISVRIDEVAFVNITKPTDHTCTRGLHPDPLPPLRTPLAIARDFSQPLWLTLYVPPDTAPGDYNGTLELAFSSGSLSIPLRVHVYDFTMPRDTHLRSALGLGSPNSYHHLTSQADKEKINELYLKNFADHRISPYSFFRYSPIDVKFTGPKTNRQATVNFDKFDLAAAKWLDEHRFNSFRLPLLGMGGGTFHSRHLGELDGFKEGTPEHARLFGDYLGQVERHLREKGWLDKAFTYWFDEPDRKDYEFVVEGMKRIRAAAPGLKRMLTEQPEPELFGHVDIWCGLTPEWTPEKVKARRAAGEEVWWYICCGPKAPYVTEFIDHPGTELRLWPWQSWQYGVQGILIWETIYWTSACAYPDKPQNPWEDPMSYVSGYDYKPGQIGYWGNGDGRFLYPPRSAMTNSAPCLEPPVNSVRWENLRDGMEDYEYFWLLENAIEAARLKGVKAVQLEDARALLKVPENVSKDLTHFTTDPRPMLEHRDKVARMIEKLNPKN